MNPKKFIPKIIESRFRVLNNWVCNPKTKHHESKKFITKMIESRFMVLNNWVCNPKTKHHESIKMKYIKMGPVIGF
jgi:hypothetical protein